MVFKKIFSGHPEGFPAYFTIFSLWRSGPGGRLLSSVKKFINWRALGLTLFFILLISLLWEATLAVPYGWWGYQPRQMLGVFIGGWSGLPVEAVCVWMAVTYGAVIVFGSSRYGRPPGNTSCAFLGAGK